MADGGAFYRQVYPGVVVRGYHAVYIQDFGKKDDRCLVAESEGTVLGAVWTRILAGEMRGYMKPWDLKLSKRVRTII